MYDYESVIKIALSILVVGLFVVFILKVVGIV